MSTPTSYLQPRAYHAFRCIGADCEDTCCSGWLINVDKTTYEAYQRCEDPDLGPRLRALIAIHPASTSDANYARIAMSGTTCPFLTDGLCGIQNKLGEASLANLCAQFPRVMTLVDGVLQRSLDLSCPEAVRVMLLDPAPMQFDTDTGAPHSRALGDLSELTTADDASPKPYRYFHEIRAFVIELLQHRAYPLWMRLVALGAFCDQLEQLQAAGQNAQTPECIGWFRQAIASKQLDAAIQAHQARPVLQLGVVLEVIVARITGDYVSPGFLACYRDFKEGIAWTSESSMEEIGARYAAASAEYYAPFLARHGHMLEHYLVNYVHRTLFPLPPQKASADTSAHPPVESIRERCLLMMTFYAVIQTVLTGMAAYRRDAFGPAYAVAVVQSVAKAFEHNPSFPARALKILEEKGIRNGVSMAVLIRTC